MRKKVDTAVAILLAEAGQLLHGEHWIAPFSEEIEINPDTLRKMISGRMAVPPPVAERALPFIRKRIAELKSIDKALNEQMKAARPAYAAGPPAATSPKRAR